MRQETIAIEALFQKKMKQADVQKKMFVPIFESLILKPLISAQSNLINKSRLKVLQAREEQLNTLFGQARTQLKTIHQDPVKYAEFIKGLLLQVC